MSAIRSQRISGEKLYNEIIAEYEKAKDKSNEKARENAEQNHGNPDRDKKGYTLSIIKAKGRHMLPCL